MNKQAKQIEEIKARDDARDSAEYNEKQAFVRDSLVVDSTNIFFEVERSDLYRKRGQGAKVRRQFRALKPQMHGRTLTEALSAQMEGLEKPIGLPMEYGFFGFYFSKFGYVQARIWIGRPFDWDAWLA